MATARPLDPPKRLVRALGDPPPEPAAAWLAALPELLHRQLERWELTSERVVTPGGRTSVVVLVRRRDGSPATLKLPAPHPPSEQEPEALAHWDGTGAVRLLRHEPGAMLLERLHAEVSLRSLPAEKAMLEGVSAVRRLWVPPPVGHTFETVAERSGAQAAALRELASAEVLPLVEEALELRGALVAESPETLLLHGDFRQGAVLAADVGRTPWLAVGPEPVVGERAWDLARLVRDRLHDLFATASAGAAAATRRRVAKLSDALEVEPERLRGWTLYRAVEAGVRRLAAGDRQSGEMLLEFAGWL